MNEPLSYHVYSSERRQWLCDDEKSWDARLHRAAEFFSLDTANAIMEREGGDYVFACMPSA